MIEHIKTLSTSIFTFIFHSLTFILSLINQLTFINTSLLTNSELQRIMNNDYILIGFRKWQKFLYK